VESVETDGIEGRIVFPLKNFLYSTPEQGAIDEICAKILASRFGGELPYAIFLGRNPNLEEGAFVLDRPGGRRTYQWRLTPERPAEQPMEEAFPKFLKLVSDPKTKFVVSFGSGGLRLFAQPSMMKFLNAVKARHAVSEVWGCSGGAISALAYAMGVEPEAVEQKGYDIYNEKFRFDLSPSTFQVLKNLIVGRFFTTPPNVLQGYVSVQETMQAAISGLTEGKVFEKPFYCVAHNVVQRRNEVLTPHAVDPTRYVGLVHQASPIDAIVASSSIPIIYVPKKLMTSDGENSYIDGATAEPVPLLSIYRKWILDREREGKQGQKLVILAIDPLATPGRKGWFMRHIVEKMPYVDLMRLGVGMFRMILQARIQNHVELLSKDPDVKVLLVHLPLRGASMLDIREIPRIIHDSQTVFLDQMLKLEAGL
jgi:hypothetical protein